MSSVARNGFVKARSFCYIELSELSELYFNNNKIHNNENIDVLTDTAKRRLFFVR